MDRWSNGNGAMYVGTRDGVYNEACGQRESPEEAEKELISKPAEATVNIEETRIEPRKEKLYVEYLKELGVQALTIKVGAKIAVVSQPEGREV